MKKFIITAIATLVTAYSYSQTNDYPITGNPSIYAYSPQVLLRRNTTDGGYVQGIQTQLVDGTNNWFFGNLTQDNWMVSKGGFQNPKFTVLSSGNVGIGTTSPDSKLTVAGKIHSQEVKVTINAGADFVFEDSYQLEKLDKLETFIKANKHLPEIASAEEMKKKGLELGEMNIKLLQKIEELTLHLIEQSKSQKALENKVASLHQQVLELKSQP